MTRKGVQTNMSIEIKDLPVKELEVRLVGPRSVDRFTNFVLSSALIAYEALRHPLVTSRVRTDFTARTITLSRDIGRQKMAKTEEGSPH